MSAPVLLITLLALYLISILLLKYIGLKGLGCTRTFSKPAYFEGDEGEMIEVVRNDHAIIIPWLRIESGVSPHIRFGRQENLHTGSLSHTCSLFTLMPYQQIIRRHRVTFLRRGAYNLGNASLTAGDLFGLFEAHREQTMDVPVLVYPRLLDESAMPVSLSLMVNQTASSRHLLQDPFLFRGIRPYQFGDPVRDIHWPATARTNEVQLRLHDPSAQCRLLVVLNMQLKDGQWGERLMDYEQDQIELGISMAATLCMQALDQGMTVGFAANMPIGDETSSAFIAPQGGEAARETLLCAFARLRIVRTHSFTTFLGQLCEHSGMEMIILSCYNSEEIEAQLAELRRHGNHTQLHLIGEGQQ